MSADTGRRPEKVRGRKRDSERTDAILEAAADLMLDVGFDRHKPPVHDSKKFRLIWR